MVQTTNNEILDEISPLVVTRLTDATSIGEDRPMGLVDLNVGPVEYPLPKRLGSLENLNCNLFCCHPSSQWICDCTTEIMNNN